MKMSLFFIDGQFEIEKALANYILKADYPESCNASRNLVEERRTENDKAFKDKIDYFSKFSSEITWKILKSSYSTRRFLLDDYADDYRDVFLLRHVLPSRGLEIMALLPNSEFDVSLLEHYREVLSQAWRYCNDLQLRPLNLPDILKAISFLLNKPEIRKQLATLPREDGFTQENFEELLLLCFKMNPEEGSLIFNQYASKIEVTTACLVRVSLLFHYYDALDSYKKKGIFESKEKFNLPDILSVIAFLLNDQKQMQEQVRELPEHDALDWKVRGSTFTQETFAQLLFLCAETNLPQGLDIFKQHASKIKTTNHLLTLMVSLPFSDKSFEWFREEWLSRNACEDLPKKISSDVLRDYVHARYKSPMTAEILEVATLNFKNSLKRIEALKKKIRWEEPLIGGPLLSAGLKMISALPNSTCDISLLNHYYQALNYCKKNAIFESKEKFSLPDILSAIEFLLNDQGMQEQVRKLPHKGTPEYVDAGHPSFTAETFSELLFICREIGLYQGPEIFEKHASKIQVNEAFLSATIGSLSDENFEWCVERSAKNIGQKFQEKLIDSIFSGHFDAINNLYNCYEHFNEKKIEVMESFAKILRRLVALNKDVRWATHNNFHCVRPLNVDLPEKEAIFLKNVLPMETLEAMESLRKGVFDISLLVRYCDALDYCIKNRVVFKNKTILNLSDILRSIDFLLKKEEIKEQFSDLPTEDSLSTSYENGEKSRRNVYFTQEKFLQLLFLCRDINEEEGKSIFEQNASNIKLEGIVSCLLKKYTAEIDCEMRDCLTTDFLSDEKALNRKEAGKRFEWALGHIYELSSLQKKQLTCRKQDFISSHSSFSVNPNGYINGVFQLDAMRLMQEKFNIQLNPALFIDSLFKLYQLELYRLSSESAVSGQQSQNLLNADAILKNTKFLMQGIDIKQVVKELESFDDLFQGCIAAIILVDMKELFQPIYEKFCLNIQRKTEKTQEYYIEFLLTTANRHKNFPVIALLSSHAQAAVSPYFLKMCSEMNDYDGLTSILENRPEFLDKLSISNKMLINNPRFEERFQESLKKAAKEELKREVENTSIYQEILEKIRSMPDSYVPDMVATIIQVARIKPLLGFSIEEVVHLALGSFLSVWNKVGVEHPDALAIGKSSESLLGSFYGYKPELYGYVIKKLKTVLSSLESSELSLLSLAHKQFCFKLSILFPNTNEVDLYFTGLLDKQTKDKPIEEIILEANEFKIPDQGYWDIDAWFTFVKGNNFSRRCMAFLEFASDMDMKMQVGDTIFAQLYQKVKSNDGSPEWEKLIQKIKKAVLWENLVTQHPVAYENLIKNYLPKRMHKKKQGLTEAPSAEALSSDKILIAAKKLAIEEVKLEISEKKDNVRLLLKEIWQVYDIRQATIKSIVALRLQDFPNVPLDYQDAVVTALENSYSNEAVRDLIIQLNENKQQFSFVPSVVIDGSEIKDEKGKKYNQYELRPLEKTDPMALVAGLKTRCCQHLYGAGMESAMHAYQSVYGITYRLAAKKNPNETDWLAQSWTVLSECGRILLFDSLEFSSHVDEKIVIAFFKKAAEKLLAGNPHLQEIQVGASHYAALKLEQHGYVRKPTDKDFRIGGYSKDSYSDAEGSIVVLLRREDFKQVQEAEYVKMHLDTPEVKQTAEEIKVNAKDQRRLRYGIATYLNVGKVVKVLGLSDEARRLFNKTHATVLECLKRDPQNPLVEEGFVSSSYDGDSRYREGEYAITYEAVELWLEARLNPVIKSMGLKHHVYASQEKDISSVLEVAKNNVFIDTFTVVAIVGGRHAVSVFVNKKEGVSFIFDSEPGSNLSPLIQALKRLAESMSVITIDPELRLQKDYYSCKVFALKSARFYAKNADTFSQLLKSLRVNNADILPTHLVPADLLKMSQADVTITAIQEQSIVSHKKHLNLLQYQQSKLFVADNSKLNTAAFEKRYKIFDDLQSVLTIKSGK